MHVADGEQKTILWSAQHLYRMQLLLLFRVCRFLNPPRPPPWCALGNFEDGTAYPETPRTPFRRRRSPQQDQI